MPFRLAGYANVATGGTAAQSPARTATVRQVRRHDDGYLVSVAEFEFVSLWRFYCLHCNRPVTLVMAQGQEPAHFMHVDNDLSDIAGACPFVLKA